MRLIPKFKNPLSFLKLRNKMKDFSVEGGLVTVILAVVAILISGSIIRVVNNARSNYEIFRDEQSSLEDLRMKNNELEEDLSYVQSDEYKKLFLRDTQGLSVGSEELFSTKEKVTYQEEVKEYLKIDTKNDYVDWWLSLLR